MDRERSFIGDGPDLFEAMGNAESSLSDLMDQTGGKIVVRQITTHATWQKMHNQTTWKYTIAVWYTQSTATEGAEGSMHTIIGKGQTLLKAGSDALQQLDNLQPQSDVDVQARDTLAVFIEGDQPQWVYVVTWFARRIVPN